MFTLFPKLAKKVLSDVHPLKSIFVTSIVLSVPPAPALRPKPLLDANVLPILAFFIEIVSIG